LEDFAEFELTDYAGIQAQKQKEVRNSERQVRRAEKGRALDEADEMKFSHSIQFNAVPDWSSKYIAYSNLKKLYAIHAQRTYHYLCIIVAQADSFKESISSRKRHTDRQQQRMPKVPPLSHRTNNKIPTKYFRSS
jgi:hypothetical protein